MVVKCQQCQKEIKIPDERVKDVQRFVVRCPNCSARILVDKNKINPNKIPAQKSISSESKVKLTYTPENVPLGKKLALLFLENQVLSKELLTYLQSKDFVCRKVKDVDEAIGRLFVNNYDLILLEDCEQSSKVLAEINSWNLKERRNVCVILLSAKGEDFDQRLAFEKSVNFCLRPGSGVLLKIEQCVHEYNNYLQHWNR